MQQPKPTNENYSKIVERIEEGVFQIPRFQRDFVWDKEKTAQFIDSLLKGFPIGSFIVWKTKERLKSHRELGKQFIKEPIEGDSIYYVLDGQQRMTSLFLALKGMKVGKNNYAEIYIDLDKDIDGDDEICTLTKSENCITFYDLMNSKPSSLMNKYKTYYETKIEPLRDHIKRYDFSVIEIENLPLSKIAEIFTRINTGGKVLTLFEIMNAKIYTESNGRTQGFDLEERFGVLVKELKYAGYETIEQEPMIVLQLISLILNRSAKRKSILSIDKKEFITEWSESIESLKKAIELMRSYLKIPALQILPYSALLVAFAYFFRLNGSKQHTANQAQNLSKYFFRSAFGGRFSSSSDTTLTSDIKLIEKIVSDESIDFNKEIPMLNEHKDYFIQTLKDRFVVSNAFDKAVLCILAYAEPRSFKNSNKIRLDNSWLRRSDSKNFHHFFPKSYLAKIKKDEFSNALANITFIDSDLNKNIIRAKDPKTYIELFQKENSNIKEDLKTHFIDLDDFGILDNNYDKFLEKRADALADEILKRI